MFSQIEWKLTLAPMGGNWEHMSDRVGGWGWGWITLFWLLSFLVVAMVAWAAWGVARRASGRPARNGVLQAEELEFEEEGLARRDVSEEEYPERREVLGER